MEQTKPTTPPPSYAAHPNARSQTTDMECLTLAVEYVKDYNWAAATIRAQIPEERAKVLFKSYFFQVSLAKILETQEESAIVTRREALQGLKMIANTAGKEGDRVRAWGLIAQLQKWVDGVTPILAPTVNVVISGSPSKSLPKPAEAIDV